MKNEENGEKRNMKPKQKLLALVVVLVIFAVGGAVATSFAAGDEESIYNWGSWGTMVTPAAGPAPAFTVQLPSGTNYQPPVNPVVVVPDVPDFSDIPDTPQFSGEIP